MFLSTKARGADASTALRRDLSESAEHVRLPTGRARSASPGTESPAKYRGSLRSCSLHIVRAALLAIGCLTLPLFLGCDGGGDDEVLSVSRSELESGPDTFSIRLVRHANSARIPAAEAALERARQFWENVIHSDIPGSYLASSTASHCGYSFPRDLLIDDIAILYTFEPLDGNGGTYAQAGPCKHQKVLLEGKPVYYSRTALLRFDETDAKKLAGGGQFDAVVRHEMAHALGVGTFWSALGLLSCETPGCKSTYRGQGGKEGLKRLSRLTKVVAPKVESDYGEATRFGHWDEDAYGNELLTGFLDKASANPVSDMTVQSLEDLGFVVNIAAAEPYTLPGQSRIRTTSAHEDRLRLGDDVLAFPSQDDTVNVVADPQ